MTRKEQYNQLILQIAGLIKDETNLVGILANVSAALHDAFPERFFWVGFYLQENGNMLRLGPFQGSVACYVIPSVRVSVERHGKKDTPSLFPM